ncbi:T9SS type A sorting domain-containing protein [Zobellia nedashkovskayae]|uniref:T9SS type A sorting domain-containing protein n=2 Tax=Zobellia nedashkovskayae TaxID=2779510 RepID=UPI001889DC9C
MKQMLTSLILLAFWVVAQAQNETKPENSNASMASINVSGGEARSSAGSVVYSVGTVFYTSIVAQHTTVSQSIQQAKESKIDLMDKVQLVNVLAYPNPTTDYVLIDIIDYKKENAQYQLFDFKGSLIKNVRITNSTTKVPMDDLESSTYFLKVSVMNKFEKIITLLKQR